MVLSLEEFRRANVLWEEVSVHYRLMPETESTSQYAAASNNSSLPFHYCGFSKPMCFRYTMGLLPPFIRKLENQHHKAYSSNCGLPTLSQNWLYTMAAQNTHPRPGDSGSILSKLRPCHPHIQNYPGWFQIGGCFVDHSLIGTEGLGFETWVRIANEATTPDA